MSRTVEVRVILPSDWPTGVSLSALVPTGTTRAVTVPASAVVRRGQLTGVRVVSAEGATLRWIRLGRTVDVDRVEVLSGLNPGDEIVVPAAGDDASQAAAMPTAGAVAGASGAAASTDGTAGGNASNAAEDGEAAR
jgi:hypothetical protein